jgi:methionyl-tRNA formyltransferase
VLTQPDRPAGRGLRASSSAVKQLALARGLIVRQPERLRSGDRELLEAARPDALIVAAYGLLLPQEVLDLASQGAWNIHASLLPRWRGAAPIQRALLAGDRETGISIMKMDAGLDTGPVLTQRSVPIAAADNTASLHDKLATLGAEMMAAALIEIAAGRARPAPQSTDGVTYARKIEKREALVDWTRSADELERAVRAFNPSPGAGTLLQGESLQLWRARVAKGEGKPGEILQADRELIVACGQGALGVLELQRSGGKRLSAAQFLAGRPLAPGDRFG